MTAPQQTESTKPQQGNSHFTQRQKLQRCWFITLGLLGGFGFVTSQMSFAIAETGLVLSDLNGANANELPNELELESDSYVAESYSAENYALEVAEYMPAQPTFDVASPNPSSPSPEAFIDVPAVPVEAASAFVEPAAAPAIGPTEYVEPEYTAPTAEPAQISYSAAALGSPSISAESVEFEISPAAVGTAHSEVSSNAVTPAVSSDVIPTVTQAGTPRFTRQVKPVTSKTASAAVRTQNSHRMTGLMDASAVAVPVSEYARSRGQATLVANVVSVNRGETLIAMAEEGALEIPVEAPAAEPAPAAVPEILPPAPVEAAPIEAAPPVAAPPVVDIEPLAETAPPEPTVQAPVVQPTEIVPAALPEGTNLPDEYNDIFVDPTDYSIGATTTPSATPDIVVSEQSTGCEFTVGGGQGVPNGACGLPSAPAPVATEGGYNAPVANTPATTSAPEWQQPAASAPVASAPAVNAPTVNVGPVSFSASGIQLSTSAAGRDYLNRSVRPLVNLQAAEQFIFPLAIPAPISSLFGFRTHPIFGDQRFHAGTDIAAEQGTPVLAAQDGVVAAADYAGGYGLMVVLQHDLEETQLESRYAHLAEIFVESGTEVKKGDIVGLVGSTGNSTGPHLHFEMRQMTADGWVLVNADGLVQASLANLVKALNNPMETLSFNLSDFNLSNLRSSGSIKTPSNSIPTFPVGQDGIPFRPAQPNAS